MPALAPGKTAPDFKLKTLHGKDFSLQEALAAGPVILAFFKVSCPTCQYAFPFYERWFRAYKAKGVALIGVSQNNADETAAFAKEYGISFPIVLDEVPTYPVSNTYGLTNVPTVFWIGRDAEIEITSVGWSKPDFELVNRRMAEAAAMAAAPMFRPGDDVRDYRAG
jgi:peroxiredoxin